MCVDDEPIDGYLADIVIRVASAPKNKVVQFERGVWGSGAWRHDARHLSNVSLFFFRRTGGVTYRMARRVKERINGLGMSFQSVELLHAKRAGLGGAVVFAVQRSAFEAAQFRIRERRRVAKKPGFNSPIVVGGGTTKP